MDGVLYLCVVYIVYKNNQSTQYVNFPLQQEKKPSSINEN